MLDPDAIKTGVDAIKVFIDVVKALKAVLPKAEERDRRLQNEVTDAIRTLYFTRRGVLSLLHQVADGEELSEERVQQALSDFNDRDWTVANALRRINFDALHREFGLSLSTIRALEQLSYRKMGLRQAVQSEVNFYGQRGVTPKKAAARRLIAAIEKLNAQIEDIDGVVNPRARSDPARRPRVAKKYAKAKKASTARKKPPRSPAARQPTNGFGHSPH
jgi:flagellar biosynthesis regulator FlbT